MDAVWQMLGLAGASCVAAAVILWALARLADRARQPGVPPAVAAPDVSFLFDDEEMVDASLGGHRLMRLRDPGLSDWQGLLALLAPRFTQLAPRLADLADGQTLVIDSEQQDCVLVAQSWAGKLRLRLDDGRVAGSPLDRMRLQSMQDELDTLRGVAEDSPQLIWKQNASGQVTWANRAYLTVAETVPAQDGQHNEHRPLWPLAPIFAALTDASGPAAPGAEAAAKTRRMRLDADDVAAWYDVTTTRRGGETIHFAVDAAPAIAAEHARHIFVQTLTKTFANLATGLAIFDRSRRLVLFNPAFLDLTGLPAGFLSDRPHVHSVLDRLRDINMLPEPRNYPSWRERVAALETAAENGTYCENWSLPTGQTYRVTGRPHPDGAIAFLFEDISDEVSLTRAFRAEQEITLAALDAMDEGLAIFSPAGTLTLSNRAYAHIWGDSGGGLSDPAIEGEVFRWRDHAAPAPFWAEALAFVRQGSDGVPLQAALRLRDGRGLTARVQRLTGGATLVRFKPIAGRAGAATAKIKTLGLSDPPQLAGVIAPARRRAARGQT